MLRLLKNLFSDFYKKLIVFASPELRIRYLRRSGVSIGQNCEINTIRFSTEAYLVKIGNNVTIASGTQFITHEGSIQIFQSEIKGSLFGKITIGNNVFIGSDCIILMNTSIGNNCIIGAGSVVRGHFPDDSVIIGNPAKVILKTEAQKLLFRQSPGLLNLENLTHQQATQLIKNHFKVN